MITRAAAFNTRWMVLCCEIPVTRVSSQLSQIDLRDALPLAHRTIGVTNCMAKLADQTSTVASFVNLVRPTAIASLSYCTVEV